MHNGIQISEKSVLHSPFAGGNMERPRRRCHVVVSRDRRGRLIGAMRDNPQGVILYSDELESLFANFQPLQLRMRVIFFSAFQRTQFKYIRKSADETHFPLPNQVLLQSSEHPAWALLQKQFRRRARCQTAFSSRFLKVLSDITICRRGGGGGPKKNFGPYARLA